MAWPLRGGKHRHAETLPGCVAFTERGAKQMRSLDFGRYALCSCVTAAMLAGCSASQPVGAPAALPQFVPLATQADGGTSWMARDAASQDLLYVAANDYVIVFTYPQGRLEGVLRHFYLADDGCVDAKGNVYIANLGYGRVYEYAHGGTKRINDIDSPVGAFGCSVDPTSGNLAISGDDGVAIYKHARGTPTTYTDSAYGIYFCGYDDKGNLFADGMSEPGSGHTILVELPKGGSQLQTISMNQTIEWPGKVQWDGKHITVEDASPTIAYAIYQFSISGSSATKIGATNLETTGEIHQTWIQGTKVVVPTVCDETCYGPQAWFYKYPAGGEPLHKKLTKGFPRHIGVSALGATVSLTPK
jgi:hypothetical protein